MKRATIDTTDGKFKLMLGDHEIGTSKTHLDASFHLCAINDAIDEAFQEGREDVKKLMGATGPIFKQESDGICKRCGGFTTYTRQNTHGLCMKCELGEKGSQSPA